MAMRKNKDADDHGFTDVSADVEQAEKDAAAPTEYDDDGNPMPRESDAAMAVYGEMSHRATAAANGGGPWPTDILLKMGTTVGRVEAPAPVYTSHE